MKAFQYKALFLCSITICWTSLQAQNLESTITKSDSVSSASGYVVDSLLYRDDFESSLKNWISEVKNPASSSVEIKNGYLDAEIKGGATIWFKPVLSGNVQIEYKAMCLSHKAGANINAFWMAKDPADKNLFTRNGDFPQYDNLTLYYGSLGGNGNITNRFREYLGNGSKPILKEYTDSAHFPDVNVIYHIKIIVFNGTTQFFVNGEKYWEYKDITPLKEGNFGFRTFSSHVQFNDFKVYRLKGAATY